MTKARYKLVYRYDQGVDELARGSYKKCHNTFIKLWNSGYDRENFKIVRADVIVK